MGQYWENLELGKLPAYILQKKIRQTPKHIFLFGAGASFGSDGTHLYQAGQLPPLGKDLFLSLSKDRNLKTWSNLSNEVKYLFESKTFEEAIDYLDTTPEWSQESLQRDLDLYRFFSKFSPQRSNLYWKLAKLISRRLKDISWSGAIVTLNYDRLLEESLMRNYVFTVVRGVTFYDDDLPQFKDNQLFEVCYPHGACQFFMGQNWLKGEGNVIIGKLMQGAGVNHIKEK
jgi:hypothetical protein